MTAVDYSTNLGEGGGVYISGGVEGFMIQGLS